MQAVRGSLLRAGRRTLSAGPSTSFSASKGVPSISGRRFESGLGYLGNPLAGHTTELGFHGHDLKVDAPIPCYHILDLEGNIVNEADAKKVLAEHDKDFFLKCFKDMVFTGVMDGILLKAQRAGSISFYMTGWGEEASVVGSAAGLKLEDEMFCQYREQAALMYRGYSIRNMVAQCYGTWEDKGKGRQMPVHYGSPDLHYQTVGSTLATQIPHAAGAGYAFRMDNADRISIVYFGDGAASEGDCHAAFNFAATLGAQTLFFCRNNGYAISTPISDQYNGDGITPRGYALGMDSTRVDGNDLLAVLLTTKEARKRIVELKRPVLIESMSYRVGHHSTSDDSTRYREKNEVDYWKDERSPVARLGRFMEKQGWLDNWRALEEKLSEEADKEVYAAVNEAEKLPKTNWEHLFEDVYDSHTNNLTEQKEYLVDHLKKYGDHYPKTYDKF